jgi:hypothetical protein
MGYKTGGKYKEEGYGRFPRLFIAIILLILNFLFLNHNYNLPAEQSNPLEFVIIFSLVLFILAIRTILIAFGYLPPPKPPEFPED